MSRRRKLNLSFMLSICFIVSSATSQYPVNADSEAPNRPYASASDTGGIYAKCMPSEIVGESGKTQVYKMGEKGEELLCSFDWFPAGIYLVDNFGMYGDFYSIVRMGFWPKGNEPNDKELAIAFYKDCKEIKRYSTADIVRLSFKNPKNIPRTLSHYTVFKKIKGFRWLEYGKYAFDVITEEGKLVSFDVPSGNIRTPADEENQKKRIGKIKKRYVGKAKAFLPRAWMRKEMISGVVRSRMAFRLMNSNIKSGVPPHGVSWWTKEFN